ncbi:MAG TPA: acyltransferase [Puia sp.]|nr:acyltransferase [Puia sp.]
MATASPQGTPSITYRPQLDGLRFLAVFGVLFYHYSTWLRRLELPFTVEMGTFISFFFVLSSYLITTILLNNKNKHGVSGKTAYNFLIRRTLRIFPAYYFYLLLLLLLPIGGWEVRSHPLSYFFYLSNFRTYAAQYWDTLTSHLWTLSVEEQFYIIWLWVILLIPDRLLPLTFYAIMVAGVVFRIVFFTLHVHSAEQTVPMVILTPSCMDTFAYGGLLAWQQYYRRSRVPLYKKIFAVVVPIWVLLILTHQRVLLLGFDRAFCSIGTVILIAGADKGYKNGFGRFLQHPWTIYLGKISYGIYLYHLLVPYVFWKIYNGAAHWLLIKHQVSLTPLAVVLVNPVVSLIFYFILTAIFASVSWYLLELPISRLKRYFTYKTTPRPRRLPDLAKPVTDKDL